MARRFRRQPHPRYPFLNNGVTGAELRSLYAPRTDRASSAPPHHVSLHIPFAMRSREWVFLVVTQIACRRLPRYIVCRCGAAAASPGLSGARGGSSTKNASLCIDDICPGLVIFPRMDPTRHLGAVYCTTLSKRQHGQKMRVCTALVLLPGFCCNTGDCISPRGAYTTT